MVCEQVSRDMMIECGSVYVLMIMQEAYLYDR